MKTKVAKEISEKGQKKKVYKYNRAYNNRYKMYDKTELKILGQVDLKPGIHKRELSKQLGLGMPSINYAIKKIEKMLTEKRSGNQIKYFLDYSKEDLSPMLSVLGYSRLSRLPAKVQMSINEFLRELKEKPLLFIIFGSYAKGDYTKDSDIDVLLIFQKVGSGKQIEKTANKISMRTGTTLNPVYLDYGSFRDSFHNSTKEFFKALKKDKIVLIGTEWWRQLKNEEA